ncbi:hypothetical protein BDY19DRAFT_982098 [Irpex rosettiformis]|uniref:Uncharacterized protein n=1 Tax=Irpex rosettiformis TaxID=378272 RepID=A0ACB8UKF6_9APHY|nr:hypothetical protein BDY19DRAFT_982098 [Irpex rosettiformis]
MNAPSGSRAVSRKNSEDESFMSDLDQPGSARSPKLPGLPDPNQFPEPPYPYKPRQWQRGTSTPTLSSADSSSASTRSSAYTSYARSGDFGHVHVAIGGEDTSPNMDISTEEVTQLFAREKSLPSAPVQGRVLIPEEQRWSYTQSTRSRSSSLVNTKADSLQDFGSPALRGTTSFDNNWEPVEEKDEIGLTSEDETDDDAFLAEDDLEEELEEQATSAMMIAEEGRGIIVRGTNVPVAQLQVNSGTTHLLIGSSSTPNAVPPFLTNIIPPIATTLLCLDISANFLSALPPALHACICLEELNIASNPLRALPVFLAGLTSLRVLIADSTGISTLPPALDALDKLHSLSVRRNKMNSLPSWLCLLPSLETLLVDGNPFLGPWKALVEPLLSKVPMSPLYPPSTPIFPLPSAGASSAQSTTVDTDVEDMSDVAWSERDRALVSVEDEDTIVPRALPMSRSVTAPMAMLPSGSPSPSLARTRTAPNKAYFDKKRSVTKSYAADSSKEAAMSPVETAAESAEREIRRMKSAGELRRSPVAAMTSFNSTTSSPQRPALSNYATSASSSNLLSLSSQEQSLPPKRFASLGVSSALSPGGTHSRPAMHRSVWDEISADEVESNNRASASPLPPENVPSPVPSSMGSQVSKQDRESRYSPEKRSKEESKTTKWGFFKKMSMGKMRTTESSPSSRTSTPHSRPQTQFQTRPAARSISSPATSLGPTTTPQIDVRISTTGTLLHSGTISPSLSRKVSKDLLKSEFLKSPPPPIPEVSVSPSPTANDSFLDIAPQSPPPTSSTNLLSPTLAPSPTPRASKRRSFLPIDVTVPAASAFMPAVQVTNGSDEPEELARSTPSPTPDFEQTQRREEEKVKEARTRALRSVMAYLRDMHDLGLPQTNALSMYMGSTEPPMGVRSRRPTMVDNGRIPSESSVSSIATSSVSDVSQLRSIESRMGLRSGLTTQTNSVATTDSNGSGGEERKWKDDKGKRQRVVKEIVETERTYVKGLQELVDIYIKPAAAPVNVLSGVGQAAVPASERKVVFSGLEALFQFHKESFLPTLERAAEPLMHPASDLDLIDADGQTSLSVARQVAQTFVSHAAFMKMYSTYINNFDNSVQRLKAWVSDRAGAPAGALTAGSSTAHLVGVGLSMSAASTPVTAPASGSSSADLTPLSSSQKKRIKHYLKRCRMNPRHSQLNLEGYLLLPVQRIPRYRLLLEELIRICPPQYDYMEDPLDKALGEISSLATNMNEGKREAENRRKLVQWQARIRGKFPSPLVQPHRRFILDGPLQLTRVVRKATVPFEVIDSKGDASTLQVECLSPESTTRSLMGVLCNDLLVLCRDPSEGRDPHSQVDLWAVLRMQTLPQPASIVHGNALRLVDNKAILYFDAPSTSDALTWFRAINLHIPASKA